MQRTDILVFPGWWDAIREEVCANSACPEEERLLVNGEIASLRERLVRNYIRARAGNCLHEHWLQTELASYSRRGKTILSLNELFAEFYQDHSLSEGRKMQYEVVRRALERFEALLREERNGAFGRPLDMLESRSGQISRLYDFLLDERRYCARYGLGASGEADDSGKAGRRPRSSNTVNDILRKVRAFSNWCVDRGYLAKSPFEKYHIESEVYGTPVCLTVEELALIFKCPISSEALSRQRDVFVFQCNIGCRVSDLLRLGPEDCADGFITYIPMKTLRTQARTVSVPLNAVAREIIGRYEGESRGRLLPFISVQKYNDSIKKILREAGITRTVLVLDPVTRTEKRVPVCDVASSHLARRTFINSIYRSVRDPELVASLTGHCSGSKAFSRYRTIDDGIKKDLVRLLERG